MEPAPDARERQTELTAEQTAELAALLRSMVKLHRRHLRRHQDAFRALSLHDRSSAEMRKRIRERAAVDSEICRAASRALDALTDGRFGICAGCCDRIPFDQLRNRLFSERCVACQES